jgi:hypothetical protein
VTTFPTTTYGSSDISDTGMVPRGFPLNGGQPVQHMNGGTHEPPAAGRPSPPPAEAEPAASPPKANDPLASMTKKQIYFDCIWLSKESTSTKLMLVCIWRYFDADARSSSMSYAQIASDCTLHETSAKRIARDILGKWLSVGKNKGFRTASGPQNLYHGICPPDLVEELRERRRQGQAPEPDRAIMAASEGVASGHPLSPKGSRNDTPSGKGVASHHQGVASGDTTLHYIEEDKTLSGADAPGACATDLFAVGAPGEPPPPEHGGASDRGAQRKRTPAKPKATDEQFARFWSAYPIREGKAAARKNFLALSHDEAELAIVGAAGYAAKIEAERTRRREEPRIKYAQGWLSERRFEDFAPNAAAPAGPSLAPYWWRGDSTFAAGLEAADWQLLHDTHAKNGTWPADMMGPPPGAPGCLVPRDVIAKLKRGSR